MAWRIQGTSITLYVKTAAGVDSLNNPVYTAEPVTVDNVLVAQPETRAVDDALSFYGKRLAYVLGIPKGDTHDWTDTDVEFFGARYHTFGDTVQGIEANVPSPWHKKVMVERYG